MLFSPKRLFLSPAIKLTELMTDFSLFAPQQLSLPAQISAMQDAFIWGNLCLCIVGNLFSFVRRQKSLVLSCLTPFATFKLHTAGGGGGKKPNTKNCRKEAKFTTGNEVSLPSCSGQHEQRVLGTELWSCAGKAQVRHLCWGWSSALCPEHIPQRGAFNSCPSDPALLPPSCSWWESSPPVRAPCLGGAFVLPLNLSVSAPGWQLQGSHCAQEAEADGVGCQELWQDDS